MKRLLFLLTIATMTAGCQTALRPYDGVLGYSSSAMPDGRFLISYTDESRASWDDMEKSAHAICAQTLSATQESARLLILKREAFSQNVNMAFMTAPGKQESGGRELQLKRIIAECVRGTRVTEAERETAPLPVQTQSKVSPQPKEKEKQDDGCLWIGGPSPQDHLGCTFFHEDEHHPTNIPSSLLKFKR